MHASTTSSKIIIDRAMSVFTDEQDNDPELLAMTARPEAHDAYLAAVKAAVEQRG